MISKLDSKFEQIFVFDEVSISQMFISEKHHTARFKRIDTLNMASFGNQLLIKCRSELYSIQSTLKVRLEQEKIILMSKQEPLKRSFLSEGWKLL